MQIVFIPSCTIITIWTPVIKLHNSSQWFLLSKLFLHLRIILPYKHYCVIGHSNGVTIEREGGNGGVERSVSVQTTANIARELLNSGRILPD